MVGNLTELETRNASGAVIPALTQDYEYDTVNRHTWTTYNGHDRSYIFQPDIDQPLAIIDHSTDELSFFHQDVLGNVIGLTDATGNITETFRYDIGASVEVLDPTGTVPTSSTKPKSPFLFTSREWDHDLGLYHYRARAYHPELGRFMQFDPIGFRGGNNLVAYVDNSIVNARDPLGLSLDFGDLRERGRELQRELQRERDKFFPGAQPGQTPITERMHDLREQLANINDNLARDPANQPGPKCFGECCSKKECRACCTAWAAGTQTACGQIKGNLYALGLQAACRFASIWTSMDCFRSCQDCPYD